MILTEKALSGFPDTQFLVKKPLSGSLDALPTGKKCGVWSVELN